MVAGTSQFVASRKAGRNDAIALVVIAAAVVASHLHFVRFGMSFDEPTWYFHFGRRALAGALPYRDYTFHGGSLPIYVDAAFQSVFGSAYAASLYAAMAITIIRVWVVWLIVRRIAGAACAALFAVWCALDPLFATQHAAAAPYVQLLVVVAALFLLLAGQAAAEPVREPRVRRYLGFAGASVGLIIAAHPGAGVTIAIALAVAAACLAVRGELITAPRAAALAAGFAAALAVVLIALAATGALGPGLHQMFADAPARSHGGMLDALSGGAFAELYRSWWGGALTHLALPIAIVAAVIYLVARGGELSPSTVGIAAIAGVLLVGLAARYALFSALSSVPRVLLIAVAALAVLSPSRARRWLGLEPIVAIGLALLALAVSWALETALANRGWSDLTPLVTGALLVTLATRYLSLRVKLVLCSGLAIMGLVNFGVQARKHLSPYAEPDSDGSLHENAFAVRRPILSGIRINEAKKNAIAWLAGQVKPGSTCFVFGDQPVLYDLLECTNPTQIDVVTAAAITREDASAAIAALAAHPPDYLIVHEPALTDAPPSVGLDGKLESQLGLDAETARILRAGLAALLDRYVSLGVTRDQLGEPLAKAAATRRDRVDGLRVYRRR